MKYVRKKIYRMMAAVMLLAVLVQSTAFAEETARNTTINLRQSVCQHRQRS